MAKITIAKDVDRQALKDFYQTALTVLSQIQTDANALQTANIANLTQAVASLRKVGKATGQLAQGLEILLKGIKRMVT